MRTIETGFEKPALTGQAALVHPCILPDRTDRNFDFDIASCGAQHRSVGHKPRADRNSHSSAADLKSLIHSRQNLSRDFRSKRGTRIKYLLVPMPFRSPRKDVAATERGLRKVGTSSALSGGCPSGLNPEAEVAKLQNSPERPDEHP